MVFCYQNCSELMWEKNCSCDREKLLEFEAAGQEFAKSLRSLEQYSNSERSVVGTLKYLINEYTRWTIQCLAPSSCQS